MVSGRKNQSVWPQGPCCEALHCISSSTLCSACGYFTSGWLLASLARCICWRHFRFVFCDCSSSVWHLYFFWESITDCIHVAAFFCFSGLVVASFCYLQFFPPPCDVDGMYYATIYYFFYNVDWVYVYMRVRVTMRYSFLIVVHSSSLLPEMWTPEGMGSFYICIRGGFVRPLYIISAHQERMTCDLWHGDHKFHECLGTKIARAISSPILRNTVAKETLYSIKKIIR